MIKIKRSPGAKGGTTPPPPRKNNFLPQIFNTQSYWCINENDKENPWKSIRNLEKKSFKNVRKTFKKQFWEFTGNFTETGMHTSRWSCL